MALFETLAAKITDPDKPFLIAETSLSPRDIMDQPPPDMSSLSRGDVVALVGGFDAFSISAFLHLLDAGMIVAPLTPESGSLDAFLNAGKVDVLMRAGNASRVSPERVRPERIRAKRAEHPILDALRASGDGGIILFSSGTTGEPKAIVHAASHFLARYATPRASLRTLAFLLFDHIGGINTMLHTLFNNGQLVVPAERSPAAVFAALRQYAIELLPASPTFLRMLLFGGVLDPEALPHLKLITYGTERMDQPTLDSLCEILPHVDFRQTYGMSELGILRVKSRARNSLWMRVGGEGVSARAPNGVLSIRAEHRMLGYLNAPQPFDAEGWLDTGDLVDTDGEWLRITGRANDAINVGGLKVMPAEVEREALAFPGVLLAKARAGSNPLTGQHVELVCQTAAPLADKEAEQRFAGELKTFVAARLPAHAAPRRVVIEPVPVSHRYKRK